MKSAPGALSRFARGTARALALVAVAAAITLAPSCRSSSVLRDGNAVRVSSSHEASSDRGVVVTVDAIASRIGADVLARGGNAVDAAIATAFALAVTYPRAGNLGGGGFMIVRMTDGREVMIDYRETAPAASTPDMFLDESGRKRVGASTLGYLAPGVPGTVAGLARAHEEFGTLPWRELVEPAEALARHGILVDDDLARSLEKAKEDLVRYPASAAIFLNDDGETWNVGDLFAQDDLAWSLEQIANLGPSAMADGPVAERLVESVRANGGIFTLDDLREYRPVVRPVLRGRYRDYDLVLPPLPSSGGITLLMMLGFLERFELAANPPNSAATLHLMAEAMRRAYRDRAEFLGDEDFVEVPVERLTQPDHTTLWLRDFHPQRATPSEDLAGAIPLADEGPETTHFSIIDRDGNAVSNTYTLNYSYGSKAVAGGTGILLNNEMDDFNVWPGRTDRKGAIGTSPNLVEPGKRMLSSMTPMLALRNGQVVLVAGSPGGRTIINTVLRILTLTIDYGLPLDEAVRAPRFHHSWFPDKIRIERGRFPRATLDELERRGHVLDRVDFIGDAHCIAVDPETGRATGVADSRIDGAVAVPSAVDRTLERALDPRFEGR